MKEKIIEGLSSDVICKPRPKTGFVTVVVDLNAE
jgi:hypothetical protein